MKSNKIGKRIFISEVRLPANTDIIFLLSSIILDKSVLMFCLFSTNGCPTKVLLIFSLSKDFFSKLNNNKT